MFGPNGGGMESKERMPIGEASIVTGGAARKINQLPDDGALPGSTAMKIANRRRFRAYAVPMVSFGAADGSMLRKGVRLDAMRIMERCAKEIWHQLWRAPGTASALRFECRCLTIFLGGKVTEAILGLNS